MRDTLIGITTMTLLFGIVWLSQNKASTNKSIAYIYLRKGKIKIKRTQ